MTQQLPPWLSLATLTYPSGAITTGLVELPLVYSGPSIPLDWPYVQAGSGEETGRVSFLEGGPILTIEGGRILVPGATRARPTTATEPTARQTEGSTEAGSSPATPAPSTSIPSSTVTAPSPSSSSAVVPASSPPPSSLPSSASASASSLDSASIFSALSASSSSLSASLASASSASLSNGLSSGSSGSSSGLSSNGASSNGLSSLSVLPPLSSQAGGSGASPSGSSGPGTTRPGLSDDNLSGGDIAGIVVGTLVGLSLLALLLFVLCLRRRRRKGVAGYISSSTEDSGSVGAGWEDLGPAGTGSGATGGAWARNGGSGLGSEARDRWMSESGQGFVYNPTPRSRQIPTRNGASSRDDDRDVTEVGVLAGTDPSRRRRWDPSIEGWRETVPGSPRPTPEQRRQVGGTMRDGRDTPDTGVTGQTADHASALEGIYGAFLGSVSRSRSALSTRQMETEETSPFIRRYRDDDDNYHDEELLAVAGAGAAAGALASRPRRPSMPDRAAKGQSSSSSGATGTGTVTSNGSGGTRFTGSTLSSRSIGLGVPSALAASRRLSAGSRVSGDPPQRRLSRKRVPTPEELDALYDPPSQRVRERTVSSGRPFLSEDSSTVGSPHDVAAAMFPMPPPSPRPPLAGPSALRGSADPASGSSRSGSDDIVVFQGYGEQTGGKKDGALRGRGGPGKRLLSGSIRESHSGSEDRASSGHGGSLYASKRHRRSDAGATSGSGTQATTSTQSYKLPPDEELFYVRPGRAVSPASSDSSTSGFGLVERQVPPEGETRPYVQSNYPGLGGDGSSPATSKYRLDQMAPAAMARSDTFSSYATSPTTPATAPPLRGTSDDSRQRQSRASDQTIATSDEAWSVQRGSSMERGPSSRTTSSDARRERPGVYRRSSRRTVSDGEGSQTGSMIGSVLAGFGLGALFGGRKRSGPQAEMVESSSSTQVFSLHGVILRLILGDHRGVPVLREAPGRRAVSMGAPSRSESEGEMGELGSLRPPRMPLERISEFDEGLRRGRSSTDARSGEEAKSESDEDAAEDSSLLRHRRVHSRHSRNTFGRRIASNGDVDIRSQVASFISGGGSRSGSSHPSSSSRTRSSRRSVSEQTGSIHSARRVNTRPHSSGTFGPTHGRSDGEPSSQSHSSGSHPSRRSRTTASEMGLHRIGSFASSLRPSDQSHSRNSGQRRRYQDLSVGSSAGPASSPRYSSRSLPSGLAGSDENDSSDVAIPGAL